MRKKSGESRGEQTGAERYVFFFLVFVSVFCCYCFDGLCCVFACFVMVSGRIEQGCAAFLLFFLLKTATAMVVRVSQSRGPLPFLQQSHSHLHTDRHIPTEDLFFLLLLISQ
jgi:hypothetical protein